MAFANSLEEIQEEVSCPLCLDFLREPVTIHCGHNFCGSCIRQRWEHLEDIFPCPVCLYHCADGNVKVNVQLCHISDAVRQHFTRRQTKKEQEEKLLCERHNEAVDRFCEEDLELLCPQCRDSPDHQYHRLVSLERAEVSQRKKLKRRMDFLKRQIEIAEMNESEQVSIYLQEFRNLEKWGKELQLELEEFHFFLRKEQVEANARLFKSEKNVQDKLTRNKNHLLSHIDTLKSLLAEMVEKQFLTDQNLLASIKSIYSRYAEIPSPTVISYELKKESCTLPPHYFSLHRMISTFEEDLILDLETAHPDLLISEDRKSVIYKANLQDFLDNPQTFTPYPAVLSCQGFDGGRHFWRVEVRGTGEWFLGVCKESFCRNTLMAPTPHNGCWPFEQSRRTSCISDKELVVRVGVFLDYELGELSFYNMNSRLFLYKFTDTFTERLMPYFSIGPSSSTLSISIVMEE
ncbi:tripartite motif-containing protein 75-like [Sorex fumeus]|uniref:tripartite motif-containing protein 75-like n=1 Tax=Sorex fumeus TaxID=62283 RepID=UPI0024AE7E30|nr:tripartite motif-containing protein 75-like [Sorex fumeus]